MRLYTKYLTIEAKFMTFTYLAIRIGEGWLRYYQQCDGAKKIYYR